MGVRPTLQWWGGGGGSHLHSRCRCRRGKIAQPSTVANQFWDRMAVWVGQTGANSMSRPNRGFQTRTPGGICGMGLEDRRGRGEDRNEHPFPVGVAGTGGALLCAGFPSLRGCCTAATAMQCSTPFSAAGG